VPSLLGEQNARAALQMADYAYVLAGMLALEGGAAELAEDPRVVEIFLGLRGDADARAAR
jgi:branched-chain amino acid transport system ATP-binding protein